ncbi:MAG: hypothetical protein NWE92_02485 [Candidatus Bathyarchaeota archaeon]|nr:hypothetical protein [Candidatus Bathyarchaeota archaeon]
MSEPKQLKCQKCGKPIGYVAVTPKSLFVAKPSLDNVQLVCTCMECSNGTGFYRRNF